MKKLLLSLMLLSVCFGLRAQSAFYVDSSNTSPTKNGLSWSTAYTNITQAVNNSTAGDTIYIAKGTYKEGSVLNITHSLTLKGGYASGGGTTQSLTNPTIIDGNNTHRVIAATVSNLNLYLSNLTIQNGHVSSASNQYASGLTLGIGGVLKMIFCKIKNNTAASTNSIVLGGGIYASSNTHLTLINCEVTGNSISSNGGVTGAAIYSGGGSFHFVNSIMAKNISTGSMSISGTAGIDIYGITDTCRITNSLICDNITNSGSASAGAIKGNSLNLLVITNSIIAGNRLNGNLMLPINASPQPQIRFSYIQGRAITTNGNIDATTQYPNFIDSANGDYRLLSYSPLINAGDNTALPPDTLDIDKDANIIEPLPLEFEGNNRIVYGIVDIGAYEFQAPVSTNPTALYVDSSNTNTVQDGLSWVTAFPNITAALNASTANDTLYIAKGTYKEGATLDIHNSLTIMGSYPSGGGVIQSLSHPTKIDGDSSYRVMEIHYLFNNTDTVSLSYLYIQNGRLTSINENGAGILNGGDVLSIYQSKIIQNSIYINTSGSSGRGGGIYSGNGELTIIDCEILNNGVTHVSANAQAGGIYSQYGNVIIKNSTIQNNYAEGGYVVTAGGILNGQSDLVIINSNIANNYVNMTSGTTNNLAAGGGIHNYNGDVTIINSRINENIINSIGHAAGGGLYNVYGQINITNTIISKNSLSGNNTASGGGVNSGSSTQVFFNNSLIADNIVNGVNTFSGGGLQCSNATINNSIVAGNIAGGTLQQVTFSSTPTVSNSYIQGINPPGTNNIDGILHYPQFVDSANGDYHLLSSSILLNAGSNSLLPPDSLDIDNDANLTESIPIDLDGNARVYGCSIDIGSYEAVYSLPVYTTINDTTTCENGTPINLVGNGFSLLKWYSDATLNNLIGTGNTINTGINNGGVYTFYVTDSAFGCPPLIIDTVVLTIYQKDTTIFTQAACNSYTWSSNNMTYTTSGTYYDTLMNTNGCDSLLILNLTINNGDTTTLTHTACNSYIWASNNMTYTASGIYYDTLMNTNGCDSLLILNLTINNGDTTTLTHTACNSYIWSSNNMTYTASGTYYDTLMNANGCDSLLILNLTINNGDTTTLTQTACNSYIWASNNMTYTTSGIYYDTLMNMNGCDSLLILNLTINNGDTTTLTHTACNSYTWSSNNMTYTTSGTFYDTLMNMNGCDSLLILNLTINNGDTTTLTHTACNSYTWSSNSMIYTTSGTYYDTLMNVNGCDSLLILNLTINNGDTTTLTHTACNSYTLLSNNMTYITSGIYYDTLMNTNGCDSLLILNLTINQGPVITIQPSASTTACEGRNIELSAQATNANSYSWYKGATLLSNGGNISGANTSTLILTEVTTSDNGNYRVIAHSANAGCQDDTSNISTLTINSLSGTLANNSATDTIYQFDGTTNTFADANCNPILMITDITDNDSLGIVTVQLQIDATVQNINGQPYLQRHYTITPANNDTATLILYATQAEMNAYNAMAGSFPLMPANPTDANMQNIRITKYEGSPFSTPSAVIIPSNIVWNATYSRWEITIQVSSFSDFYIHTGSHPLEIKLTKLYAENHGDKNRIEWNTVSEEKGDVMILERSSDGKTFTTIHQETAQGTPGIYTYWDVNILSGINYYRLKMPNPQGEVIYSNIVSVRADKEQNFVMQAYPNPLTENHNRLTVEIKGMKGRATITILDQHGRHIMQTEMPDNKTLIDMTPFANGVYYIRYRDEWRTETMKLIRE